MDTSNLVAGIDLSLFQQLQNLPVYSAAGCCMCNDERGTDRYIYVLFNATNFWRYDTWADSWQQLHSPPSSMTFAAGCSMAYDPSRGYVWLFVPLNVSPWNNFFHYRINADTWYADQNVTGLSAQWSVDSSLIHTCPAYNAVGDDDALYLIGNNKTTWYKYSVSAATWTSITPVLPYEAAEAAALVWAFGYNPDRIYYILGGTTSGVFYYIISTSTWYPSNLGYIPQTETFTTGSCYAGDAGKRIYFMRNNLQYVSALDLDAATMTPAGKMPMSAGTGIVGRGLVFVKIGATSWVYFRYHSSTYFTRMLVGWF